MVKKLGSFVAAAALFAASLISTGTAHATCTFGQISAVTHGTDIISSQVFGSRFVFLGQNQPPFNGGYSLALTQRWDNASSTTTGVHGVAYTNQVAPNGAVTQVTTGFSNLQNRAVNRLPANPGLKIGNIQVLVYFCG